MLSKKARESPTLAQRDSGGRLRVVAHDVEASTELAAGAEGAHAQPDTYVIKIRATQAAYVVIHTAIEPAASIDRELPETPESEFDRAFAREDAAFNRMLPGLLSQQGERWVAIHDERVVESGGDVEGVTSRVRARFGRDFVLIRFVSRCVDALRTVFPLESPEIPK